MAQQPVPKLNRLFLYSYVRKENYDISIAHLLFGARDSDDGLPEKVKSLMPGDLIIIKAPRTRTHMVEILGCGAVIGQHFRCTDPLWPDDVYPWRVPVDFSVPQPRHRKTRWDEWQDLNIRKIGRVDRLTSPQEWGAFFKGNFIERPADVTAVCDLLGISGQTDHYCPTAI